jgi:putative toxin-antitoxin system antitoxin component (TIGR02293 family)
MRRTVVVGLTSGNLPIKFLASCHGGASMMQQEPVVEAVYRKLGGNRVLGRDVASEADLVKLILARIPLAALRAVQQGGFSEREIERFVIPSRTRRHREARKEPLTVEESDRLVRLTRIQALAEDVFGSSEKANRWLRQRLGILDGQAPLDLAQTEAGVRVVEQILGKIAWGAAA